MHKILPAGLSTADNDTPPENTQLQRLIERAEYSANVLEGIGNSVRLLELERQHEACIPEPFVRFRATIKLSSVYSFTGTEQELRDAVVDELCAMFNLRRR